MNTRQRAAATVHLAALGITVGIIIATAAAAAILFPTVRTIDPVILHLDASTRPHWLLVAGKPAAAIFSFSFAAQLTLMATAVVTWFYILPTTPKGRCRAAWSLALLAAASVLVYLTLFHWPAMRTDLHTYWQATAEGRFTLAAAHQAAFNAAHPTASNLMFAVLLTTLLALLSGTWALLSAAPTKAAA